MSDTTASDLEKAHERIQQYVREAEAHMGLPPNTIANVLADNDFVFVVKACAVIEPLLKEAVREYVKRNLDVGAILISENLAVPFVCGQTRCPPTPKPWCK